MSEIDFFMTPNQLFSIVESVVNKHSAKIIFRRFTVKGYVSGWKVMSGKDNLADEYGCGGYSKIYISLEDVPKHEKDWDFVDNASDELLEISGGRLQDANLEMAVLRTVSKKTRAKNIFNDIKKEITAISEKGNMMISSSLYPNIYYTTDVVRYCLFTNIDDKSLACRICRIE